MKNKRCLTILLLAITALFLSVQPASGGSHKSFKGKNFAFPPPPPFFALPPMLGGAVHIQTDDCRHRHDHKKFKNHRGRRGHWEWRKVWIPPSCRRVWQEGHYDSHHRWVPGNWVKIRVPGHWAEEKVWVPRHKEHRHHGRYRDRDCHR